MDFRKLHEPYKDEASPSVELQIRWLQKMGFPPHQIDQAMIMVYGEIERGEITFKTGTELNLYLKEVAVSLRKEELTAYVNKLQEFEKKLRDKHFEEFQEKQKRPWYKRLFLE